MPGVLSKPSVSESMYILQYVNVFHNITIAFRAQIKVAARGGRAVVWVGPRVRAVAGASSVLKLTALSVVSGCGGSGEVDDVAVAQDVPPVPMPPPFAMSISVALSFRAISSLQSCRAALSRTARWAERVCCPRGKARGAPSARVVAEHPTRLWSRRQQMEQK